MPRPMPAARICHQTSIDIVHPHVWPIQEYRSALASSSSSFPQGSDSLSPVSQNAQLNRSPSIFTTSTALSDLREQGKKPSNLLRTFLNRGGSGRDGERSDSVLRYLGAKSEAEEAGV